MTRDTLCTLIINRGGRGIQSNLTYAREDTISRTQGNCRGWSPPKGPTDEHPALRPSGGRRAWVPSIGGQNTIRVLVIDERTVVREGLRVILGADPLFEVIAMVGQLDAGISVARETHPDVVLMELPPRADGDLIRSLRQELPDASLVVLTDLGEEGAIAEALREGAVAYIVQDASADKVRSTIRWEVPRWRARTSPTASSGDPGRDMAALLTKREHDVLARIAEGKPQSRHREGARHHVRDRENLCETSHGEATGGEPD